MPDFAADLDLALALADAADEISLARFGAADLAVDTKPDLSLVSDADRAVEATLRST
ncbi:MAG: histidinol-phosphatase, partial [Actinomycetota bacterium]|nr:histidinol-phosphatase [Actinomycetota bacterium]